VTTNGLGTPVKALEAARKAVRREGRRGERTEGDTGGIRREERHSW